MNDLEKVAARKKGTELWQCCCEAETHVSCESACDTHRSPALISILLGMYALHIRAHRRP
jgi:hypothetical protein